MMVRPPGRTGFGPRPACEELVNLVGWERFLSDLADAP